MILYPVSLASEWTSASTRPARTTTARYPQRRIERREELGQRDTEGAGQLRDILERRIPFAALDAPDIGPVKAGARRRCITVDRSEAHRVAACIVTTSGDPGESVRRNPARFGDLA